MGEGTGSNKLVSSHAELTSHLHTCAHTVYMLCMYICSVYTCMYADVYACTSMSTQHTCAHIYVLVYICTVHAHMCMCIYMFIGMLGVHMYVCTHACTAHMHIDMRALWVYTHACVGVCIYVHTSLSRPTSHTSNSEWGVCHLSTDLRSCVILGKSPDSS